MTDLINRLLAGCVSLAAALILPVSAFAQGGSISLIRDAEVEATIRAYADPIFKAAGLDASNINVHLIDDDRINAFVAPGLNMFINTGLLMKAEDPNQVIGVIAHETGHIAGGHLVRFKDAIRNATIENIACMLLTVGGAVASGGGAAPLPTICGEIAKRGLLKYSRVQEASADQAGMKFLDATQQSSRGLLEFFKKLEGQEFLLNNQDPYLSTHPLTTDRIDSVAQHVSQSPYSDAKDSPALIVLHERMLAKLKGFLWPLGRVLQTYPEKDMSIPSRYARAIAYFRVSRLKESLALMDSLLAEAPDDPFFLEQKGQILFQNGRLEEALPLYQRAVDLRPREALLHLELGQLQIEMEQDQYVKAAVSNLEMAAYGEPNNSTGWHFLAIAYGRSGDIGMSALAKAEEALAQGNHKEARAQAQLALDRGLKDGSPGWIRAQDILSRAQDIEDE
jgi:predicted Zn-dependent protease